MTEWDAHYMNKPLDLPTPTEPLSDAELESQLMRLMYVVTAVVLLIGAALAYAAGVL